QPSISEHDKDTAVYVQDSWRPHPRITTNLGLRVDWIRRHDELLNIYRERSTAVQPRLGVAYLVTQDARNVLRASYSRLYEQVDINGIYPSGPNQPFGGFGLIDPNQGIINKETNGNWTRVIVENVEGTLAKNMSHNVQLVLSLSRQWQHLEGTWNPTDPARFIQPGAFTNDGDLSTQLFGNGDSNTLNGGGRESGAAYRPFSVRLASPYHAPWNVSLGASYVIQAGGYVGPVVT